MAVTFTSNYREIYDEVVVSGIDSLLEQNYDLQSILEFLDEYGPARFSYYEDYVSAGEDYYFDPVDTFLRSARADWNALPDFGEIYLGEFSDPEDMAIAFWEEGGYNYDIPHYLEIDWRATADNLIGDEVWNVGEYYFRYR
jgi:hypothetical protein